MSINKDIPVNPVADVDDFGNMFYKTFNIMCKIDTGIDCSTVYVAQFYKKEAAFDYCSYLNDNLVDDLFFHFYVEEDELYEKK